MTRERKWSGNFFAANALPRKGYENMKRVLILMTGTVLLLAGCGEVAEQYSKMISETAPVMVIAPGYKVVINGEPTPIYGTDECPKEDPKMIKFFGPDPLEGQHSCIVVAKDRTEILVRFNQGVSVQEEHWTILRGEAQKFGLTFPTAALRRPDGSIVLAADKS